jgi:hypothetical protein
MHRPLRLASVISDAEKARVIEACERLLADVFKPLFLPKIWSTPFNYPVDILRKLRGAQYRFIQRHRSGLSKTLGEELDAPFARLDRIAPDGVNNQWHRHTGRWWRLHRALTPTSTLNAIKADGHIHPL